ncbi:MAG: hypothetical protein M3R27_05620 [Bacteroidota bacterium]|nr:hypothetical protein [Bacteroidota bacterium]
MFIVNYYKKNKLIGEVCFETDDEAQESIDNSDNYSKADRYEIINSETDEIISADDIPDNDEIINEMFDGEDSIEGFDWTK